MLETERLKVNPSTFKLRAALIEAMESAPIPTLTSDTSRIPRIAASCETFRDTPSMEIFFCEAMTKSLVADLRVIPLAKVISPALIATNLAACSGFSLQVRSPSKLRFSDALRTSVLLCPFDA